MSRLRCDHTGGVGFRAFYSSVLVTIESFAHKRGGDDDDDGDDGGDDDNDYGDKDEDDDDDDE